MDIELVIKISEEDYFLINRNNFCRNKWKVYDAIKNGTPLPKGHGRLGDLDELAHKMVRADIDNLEGKSEAVAGLMLRFCHKTDTIIEADKEKEDKGMINCDNQCENCGKYTTVHYNGTEYTEYNCIVADKDVRVVYDENGNEEHREVF